MDKYCWQLPTNQSHVSNCDYIRYNAKLHCYVDNKSLCNKHSQQTNDFENYDLDQFLNEYGEKYICKKCLNKYMEKNIKIYSRR